MHVCVCVCACVPSPSVDLNSCFFFCLPHSCLLPFVFLSGGDKDESEDSVGDLRRTESDSVLKKVGISAASYCLL